MAEQLRLTPGEVNKVLAAAVETNRDNIDVSRLIADAATAQAVSVVLYMATGTSWYVQYDERRPNSWPD